MCEDEKVIKELMIGRRVGFYRVRGEIGYGTFSRVKLAFHALTKGVCVCARVCVCVCAECVLLAGLKGPYYATRCECD